MFGKKKEDERVLTHVKQEQVACGTPSNTDDVQQLIDIINENMNKVPLDIYNMIKGIPDEVITSDMHDRTRKSLLEAMCRMARNNEEMAEKVTKKIVNIAERKA